VRIGAIPIKVEPTGILPIRGAGTMKYVTIGASGFHGHCSRRYFAYKI
jgi:hypothetical protein